MNIYLDIHTVIQIVDRKFHKTRKHVLTIFGRLTIIKDVYIRN